MKDTKNIENNENRIISYIFLAVVLLLFAGIILRIFTRTVLVSHFKMNNAFTNVVFFDSKGLSDIDQVNDVYIDWETMYPHESGEIADAKQEQPVDKGIYLRISDKISAKMFSLETKINDFTTAYLPGYNGYVYMANKYKKVIGWNFVSYSEYNGIIELDDGYLSTVNEKRNIEENAMELEKLSVFCNERGIPFSYIPAPEKLCKIDDADYSGSIDYSNQNADELLFMLNARGVNTVDLRMAVHEEGINHHSLYFKTDHHWTPEGGVWAAEQILNYLDAGPMSGKIGEIYDINDFSVECYKKWFLGSQGKKVTLANTEPDDISLLKPMFESRLSIEIPSLGLYKEGDFDITYDYDQISVKDYNKKSPYHAYCYGDRALVRIKNQLNDKGGKVLIIRDSFGDVVVPFVALSVYETVSVDPRYFTGSLKSFIEAEAPDVVIVLIGEGEITTPDYNTYRSLWDLR